jgi:hypothetical protein
MSCTSNRTVHLTVPYSTTRQRKLNAKHRKYDWRWTFWYDHELLLSVKQNVDLDIAIHYFTHAQSIFNIKFYARTYHTKKFIFYYYFVKAEAFKKPFYSEKGKSRQPAVFSYIIMLNAFTSHSINSSLTYFKFCTMNLNIIFIVAVEPIFRSLSGSKKQYLIFVTNRGKKLISSHIIWKKNEFNNVICFNID